MNSLTPIEEYPPALRAVAEWARQFMGCDTARISTFEHSPVMFLTLGYRKQSHGEWFNERGEPLTFAYVEEFTPASGTTPEELRASLREYSRLRGMSTFDYLRAKLAEEGIHVPQLQTP